MVTTLYISSYLFWILMMATEKYIAKSCLTERIDWIFKKFVFGNRVVDYWIGSKIKVELKPEMKFQQLLMYDSGLYMA